LELLKKNLFETDILRTHWKLRFVSRVSSEAEAAMPGFGLEALDERLEQMRSIRARALSIQQQNVQLVRN
jgi:hypothetical protein